MSDWYWVLVILGCGASFLLGRWRGIKDFESAMVEKGLLPPHEDS